MTLRVLFLLFILFIQPLFAESAEGKAQEPQKAILILDASGSMWGKVGGKAKIEIAREVVKDLLADWNPDLHLGLMTYGHRSRGDCNDIELLIPPGKVDKEAFLKAVNQLTPKGKTPLTAAVLQAAEVLRAGEERATVILVSDGVETCGKDPCEAAAQLKKEGFDFTAHVVGFDLSATEQKSIRCLADETGGLFLAANDAASLKSSLETVVKQTIEPAATPAPTPEATPEPAPEPTPAPKAETVSVTLRSFLTEGGHQVDGYYTIEDLEDEESKARKGSQKEWKLKPGAYEVKVKWQTIEQTRQIEITEEPKQTFDFILESGIVQLSTRYSEGGEEAKVYYTISTEDSLKKRTRVTAGSQKEFHLPAGKYIVEAKIGATTVEQEIEIQPGETTTAELNLNGGLLELKTTIGESEEAKDAYYTIFKVVGMVEPKKEQVAGGSKQLFTLPAGKYVVSAKWGYIATEKEIEVKGGERNTGHLILEGGVLALSAQNAEGGKIDKPYYEVFQIPAGLEGKSPRLAFGTSDTYRLPTGKYRVTTKHGDQTLSAEVEIKTGERTEVVLKP